MMLKARRCRADDKWRFQNKFNKCLQLYQTIKNAKYTLFVGSMVRPSASKDTQIRGPYVHPILYKGGGAIKPHMVWFTNKILHPIVLLWTQHYPRQLHLITSQYLCNCDVTYMQVSCSRELFNQRRSWRVLDQNETWSRSALYVVFAFVCYPI